MVFVDKNIYDMLNELGRPKLIFDETWVPRDHPGRHSITHTRVSHRPSLFTDRDFSKGIIDLVEPDPKSNYFKIMELALAHAFENALTRGHEMKNNLPVSVELYIGDRGAMVRVEDSGRGFLSEEYIRKWKEGDRSYVNGLGQGFNHFGRNGLQVSFEAEGRAVNIMGLYDET
jgi:hypothetical protein